MSGAGAPGKGQNVPKQLRDVGGRPMLVAVLDALDASRLEGAVVVVNPQIAATIEALRPTGPRRVYAINERPEREMIESVQMGIRTAMAASAGPAGAAMPSGFLVCPGDHPRVTPSAVNACIAAFASDEKMMVIAVHRSRRGHPVIVPADLAAEVLSWPPGRGLNHLREQHPGRVRLAEIDDPGVLVDVDTPGDLAKMRR